MAQLINIPVVNARRSDIGFLCFWRDEGEFLSDLDWRTLFSGWDSTQQVSK